jgi:hypothetical protein
MGKTQKKHGKAVADNETGEDRFRAAETRPQFRSVKKQSNKVVLYERFASVLTDSRFQLDGKDKYGRKKTKEVVKDELSAFYTVEKEEQKEEQDKEQNRDPTQDDDSSSSVESSNDSSGDGKDSKVDKNKSEDDEGDDDPASRIAYLTAFSRGELDVSSSSDEDDSSQSSDEEGAEDGEDPVHGTAGVLDPSNNEEEIELTEEPSPFLVVMNMDWEHVRAVDLFSILSSFTPPGAVKRVQVYPSDFGMESMEKEKLNGPSGLWKKTKPKKKSDDDDSNINLGESDGDEELEDEDESGDESSNQESVEGEKKRAAYLQIEPDELPAKSDFDPEKLRSYEASKLKYYFAIVEFSNTDHADVAYRELDNMEFEHSSSKMDLRSLTRDDLDGVVKNRSLRDEATSTPSNYVPPDFVVSALQQTTVRCTWDMGDRDREQALTKYRSGGWEETEEDALRAYLASDVSSNGDEDDGSDEDDDENAGKGSKMRKLLGLDSDDDGGGKNDDGSEGKESSAEDQSDDEEKYSKELKFIPGKKDLEDKIRLKLESKDEQEEELTPWQKYTEKRKEKKRERRQASRNKRSGVDESRARTKDEPEMEDGSGDEAGGFFLDEDKKGRKKPVKRKEGGQEKERASVVSDEQRSKQELELLLAGEDEEEQARDYDIRGIQRMDKIKDKKLTGSRKRKEVKLASTVSGAGFKINVEDNRFAAVLDGSDHRFGIDKTDPNFKETPAMREILAEQTQRRQKKRRKVQPPERIAPNVSVESGGKNEGASALSSLVKRLKSKVAKVQ